MIGADRTGDTAGTGVAFTRLPPLSDDERAACAVCADWLATAHVAAVVAWLGVAAGLGGLATGGVPHAAALLLLLAVAERVLALRVAFDARLFARLADGSLDLATLDHGLQAVLAVPARKAGRRLGPRLAGARRLYRWHAACAVLIAATATVTWMT